MRPEQYLSASPEQLATERANLVGRISDLRMDLGRARSQEVVTKAQAWRSSGETTATGRERDAQAAAYAMVASIREMEGEEAALTVCLEFLAWCEVREMVSRG